MYEEDMMELFKEQEITDFRPGLANPGDVLKYNASGSLEWKAPEEPKLLIAGPGIDAWDDVGNITFGISQELEIEKVNSRADLMFEAPGKVELKSQIGSQNGSMLTLHNTGIELDTPATGLINLGSTLVDFRSKTDQLQFAIFGHNKEIHELRMEIRGLREEIETLKGKTGLGTLPDLSYFDNPIMSHRSGKNPAAPLPVPRSSLENVKTDYIHGDTMRFGTELSKPASRRVERASAYAYASGYMNGCVVNEVPAEDPLYGESMTWKQAVTQAEAGMQLAKAQVAALGGAIEIRGGDHAGCGGVGGNIEITAGAGGAAGGSGWNELHIPPLPVPKTCLPIDENNERIYESADEVAAHSHMTDPGDWTENEMSFKKMAYPTIEETEKAIQDTYDRVMEENDPIEKAAADIGAPMIGRKLKQFNLLKHKINKKTPEQEADEAWERTKGLLMENPLA